MFTKISLMRSNFKYAVLVCFSLKMISNLFCNDVIHFTSRSVIMVWLISGNKTPIYIFFLHENTLHYIIDGHLL